MSKHPKAYAPRKMRDNNKPTRTMASLWLKELDVKAKEAMSADIGPDGFSRVSIDSFLDTLTLAERQEQMVRERYAPFFAQVRP